MELHRDTPLPHDSPTVMDKNKEAREKRYHAIREELKQWMNAPHENPTHETQFHGEGELDWWVDTTFAINADNGSVMVKNANAFSSIVRVQKGLPPYLTEIKGNVTARRMGITSLETLRGITIHGDLSLAGITDETLPDNLSVDGRFVIMGKVPEKLVEAITAKYGKEKVWKLNAQER